jgi:hypothetical protein
MNNLIKKNILPKLLAAFLLLPQISISHAGDYSEDKKWRFGFEAGQVNVTNLANGIATANGLSMVNTFGGTAAESVPNNISEGRIFFGKHLSENWGFETGYFYTSPLTINYRGVTGHGVSWTGQTSNSIGAIDLMATLRGSSGTFFENYFVKYGIQDANLNQTNSISAGGSTATANFNKSGVGSVFAFGYDRQLFGNFDGRLTYTYMNNIGGQTGLTSYIVNAGLVYKF